MFSGGGVDLDPSQYSSEAKGLRAVPSSSVQSGQSASFKLLQRALETDAAAVDDESSAAVTAAAAAPAVNGIAATNGMTTSGSGAAAGLQVATATAKTVPG